MRNGGSNLESELDSAMYDLSRWVAWRVQVKRCAALVLAPENVKREGGQRWLAGCEGLREHKDAGFIESQARSVLIIFHQLEFGTRFYSVFYNCVFQIGTSGAENGLWAFNSFSNV